MIDETRPSSLYRARWAVSVMFFNNGVAYATWASRIPAVKDKIGLSESELGLALFGVAAGVLSALSVVGYAIARWGSETVTCRMVVFLALVLALLPFMSSFAALTAMLFVFGAAMGAMDIAMNAQGVVVEDQWKRSILTSFHALFSIGGLMGAALGAAMAALKVEPQTHFIIAAVLMVGLSLGVGAWLLPTEKRNKDGGAPFALPSRALWGLGVIAFCCAVGEGAMADWTALYLRESLETAESVAVLGFMAFSVTMAGGRLIGDKLKDQFGAVRVVRVGGIIATGGLALAVWVPLPITAIIGFGLTGAGLSSVIPLVFSAAGRTPNMESGAALASVATVGYAGFLAGPPVIGFIAEGTSLQLGLGLVMVMASLIAVFAATVRR